MLYTPLVNISRETKLLVERVDDGGFVANITVKWHNINKIHKIIMEPRGLLYPEDVEAFKKLTGKCPLELGGVYV